MKKLPTKKNTPTKIVMHRIIRRCSSGVNGFFRSGSTTSCAMVNAAEYIRESSVEIIAITSSRQNIPCSPGGSRSRMVTASIIW